MATETISGPLGEVRAVSTAGGGTALTTTAQRILLPFGTKWISLTPRNFSTAVVAKFNFNPWLTVFKTTDALATTLTDYSVNAQDGSTSTDVTLSSLSTAAALDFVYVGSHLPFGGVAIDVDAANGTASVLTVKYWKSDLTWTDISATDGTDSGGASMAVDGSVTWTVPTDWDSVALNDSQTGELSNQGLFSAEMYWTRWEFSGGLDSTTTQNSWLAINRSTAYAELSAGQSWEQSITVGPGGVASLTALTDAGTGNLIINAATRQNGRFV